MDRPKRACVAAGFPDDPLVEILSRVPAKSLCQFKCVSKAWRDLIADPLHRKKLPQAMEGLFFMLAESHCYEVRHLGFIDVTARSVPLNIEPSFSVLKGLPEIQGLVLVDSCNGLMLLENRPEPVSFDALGNLGYIVFNPTTKQWGAVPSCGCTIESHLSYTYLAFDPAISSHFHLIHWNQRPESEEEGGKGIISVHAYSSETGEWSHSQGLKGWRYGRVFREHTFFKNMLHLFVWNKDLDKHQILVVDVQGKVQRVMPLPVSDHSGLFQHYVIAHSQGLLHCIHQDFDADSGKQLDLYVWVLEDYDAKEWVRKEIGRLPKLVGGLRCIDLLAAMHQDHNTLFFVKVGPYKMIAYDMDRKEARVLTTPGNESIYEVAAPYVPYFADSLALANWA